MPDYLCLACYPTCYCSRLTARGLQLPSTTHLPYLALTCLTWQALLKNRLSGMLACQEPVCRATIVVDADGARRRLQPGSIGAHVRLTIPHATDGNHVAALASISTLATNLTSSVDALSAALGMRVVSISPATISPAVTVALVVAPPPPQQPPPPVVPPPSPIKQEGLPFSLLFTPAAALVMVLLLCFCWYPPWEGMYHRKPASIRGTYGHQLPT